MGGGKLIFHVQRGAARWRDNRRRSTGSESRTCTHERIVEKVSGQKSD
jgi:hypothetical protein